jgi:enoyl-CoA hydratase/carnithine racemase
MKLPKLPPRASYLAIDNPRRRNALSLSILRDLRDQLQKYNTSPVDNNLRLLPPFQRSLLPQLEAAQSRSDGAAVDQYGWLVDSHSFSRHRGSLPKVVVLRPSIPGTPVFSSGHDLTEVAALSPDEVRETFAVCAEVMTLIRRSPAPVISVVEGLATAAGAQLALSADLPFASSAATFRLPGASIGLPCSSPSTALSRRLGNAFTYRMLALAEPVRAQDLPGGVVEVVADGEAEDALERRVSEVVERLAGESAGMPMALGKWAFWTQVGIRDGGDGYEDAVDWTGRIMALHARSDDAREGMAAFLGKRKPVWCT